MILKFYMQHDEAAGLLKNKIQAAQESDIAKNTNPLKSTFPPEPLDILAKILYRALVAP